MTLLDPPIKPMLANRGRDPARRRVAVRAEVGWLPDHALLHDGDDIQLATQREPLLPRAPRAATSTTAQPSSSTVRSWCPTAIGRGLNFDTLDPSAPGTFRMLAVETPSFVAFDLLALGDRALLKTRRCARAAKAPRTELRYGAPVFLTPSSTDRAVAESWFSTFEGAGLDGVITKRLDDVYTPDKRTMVKVNTNAPPTARWPASASTRTATGSARCCSASTENADGRLHHVTVAAAFHVAFRSGLEEAEAADPRRPSVRHDLAEIKSAPRTAEYRAAGTRQGSCRRSSAERVAEVTFGQLKAGHFATASSSSAGARIARPGLWLRPARRRHARVPFRGVAGDLDDR